MAYFHNVVGCVSYASKTFESFYIGSILFQNQVILKQIVRHILKFPLAMIFGRVSTYSRKGERLITLRRI